MLIRPLLPFLTLCLASMLPAAMVPAPARASSIVVWPIDPKLEGGARSTALWIENLGETPATMQIRTFAWTQVDGQEVLSEQSDVVASPPIATVAPGARQMVRIVRRSAATDVPESAYRLLIDELPSLPSPDAAASPARLTVQMRYSVPLFVYASKPADTQAALSFAIDSSAAHPRLVAHNNGTRHARLSNLRTVSNGSEQAIQAGLVGYVLPGSTMAMPLPAGAPAQLRVTANGRDEQIRVAD